MFKIKMHQFPGDVPRQEKAAMLEGKEEKIAISEDRTYNKNRSKAFKHLIRSRLRAVLKERTRIEINKYTQDIE